MLSVDVGYHIHITLLNDGLCRSWIDHIVRSQSFLSLVSDISESNSGCNLYDHSPLFFHYPCYLWAIHTPMFSFLFLCVSSEGILVQGIFCWCWSNLWHGFPTSPHFPLRNFNPWLISKLLTCILIHLYKIWNLVPFLASLLIPLLLLLSLNYLVGKMVLASSESCQFLA